MKRLTNQKITILDFLRGTKIHPTAEEVYLNVQKNLPRISQATVYRILDEFVKENLIKSIPGKKTRFDGNDIVHQHFICKKCGKLTDIYDGALDKYLNKKKNLVADGTVDDFEITFYGRCKKCS